MENITIYKQPEISTIPQHEQKFLGYVYAIEFGNYIKIGCTKCPYRRILQLRRIANYNMCKIKQIALSEPHVNYKQNEHLLHLQFDTKRIKGTELFNITLIQAINAMKELHIDKNITFVEQKSEDMRKLLEGWSQHEKNKSDTIPQAPLDFYKNIELDDIDAKMEIVNLDNETQAQISIETYYHISNCGNNFLLLMNQKDLNKFILNLIELSTNISTIKLNNKNK